MTTITIKNDHISVSTNDGSGSEVDKNRRELEVSSAFADAATLFFKGSIRDVTNTLAIALLAVRSDACDGDLNGSGLEEYPQENELFVAACDYAAKHIGGDAPMFWGVSSRTKQTTA